MIGADKIIQKKKEFLFPSSHGNHFYKNPPQIVKGDMQYLYDDQGKEYIDFFAGVSVMNCGHCKCGDFTDANVTTYDDHLFNRANGEFSREVSNGVTWKFTSLILLLYGF